MDSSSPTTKRYVFILRSTCAQNLPTHTLFSFPLSQAFKTLLWEISRVLSDPEERTKRPGLPKEMNFYFHGRLYPKLLRWLLTDAKLRLVRQVTLMGRGGGPLPALREEKVHHSYEVYCPSICY